MSKFTIHHSDCLNILKTMPDNSVDSIVTDPPYGLKFMGKAWDYEVPNVAIWVECLRVLKPGGHLLAFASTRTQHRMALNIEDAGFELRDMITFLYDTNVAARELIHSLNAAQLKLLDSTFGRDSMMAWMYGSGFPKSHNLEGEWEGWGTSLKPAIEPITMARKPFMGSVAVNVIAHGVGALNINLCRVQWPDGIVPKIGTADWGGSKKKLNAVPGQEGVTVDRSTPNTLGRWPANVIHDGSTSVLNSFPYTKSGADNISRLSGADQLGNTGTAYNNESRPAGTTMIAYGDEGSAARFFYCAKASPAERHAGLGKVPHQFKQGSTLRDAQNLSDRKGNHHPTVKPIDLMRYLIRLVTRRDGTVLDPFCGSGSTGVAAILEGMEFVGIEREEDYVQITRARCKHAYQGQQDLFGGAVCP